MEQGASSIDMSIVNPLVQSFLFWHPKHRYSVPFADRSNYARFEDYVSLAVERLTDEQLLDFQTRFTFLKRDVSIKTMLLRMNLVRWTKNSYFTERSKCSKEPFGLLSSDFSTILSLDVESKIVLAEKKASFQTYYYYNTNVLFAGVIGEVICQIPPQFLEKTNDNSYYIVMEDEVSFGTLDDMHVRTLTLYEQKK
jgi:hypothetical protein